MQFQPVEHLFQPLADVYGFLRDEHGRASFQVSEGADKVTSLKPMDAKAIAETDLPVGGIPGLEPARVGVDSSNRDYPRRYIITSPNMWWLPDVTKYRPSVRMNEDTRFGYHDFTIWPELYFAETRHLAFTRSRPTDSELKTHPFAILWHDLTRHEFEYEPGTIFTDLGRITSPILDQMFDFRRSLTTKIKALLAQPPSTIRAVEKAALTAAEEGMRLTSVCLRTAAQSFFMTQATFTLFQRHALKGLACVEMLTIWAQKTPVEGEDIPLDSVDPSVIGAITTSLYIAIDLAMLGVPVWLIRPPHTVPSSSIKILGTVYPVPIHADRASVKSITTMKDFYTGPPSYGKNRACLALHLGHFHLGGRGEVYKEIVYVTVPSGLSDSIGPSAPSMSTSRPPVPYRGTSKDDELTAIGYTVNVKKFKPVVARFSPSILPRWEEALRQTPCDYKLILKHEDARLLRGYALMDPWLLARDDRIGERNLAVWLFMRSAWISQVTTSWASGLQFPSSQDWRYFTSSVARRMGFDWSDGTSLLPASSSAHPLITKKSTKKLTASRSARDSTSAIEASLVTTFPLNLPPSISKQDLYWRGQLVLKASEYNTRPCPISDAVRSEVLWDLLEQNFRIELLAMDRCVVSRTVMSLAEANTRDEWVSQVFPSGSPVNTNMSEESVGARHQGFRAKYLNGFRRVVQTWGQIGDPLKVDRFRNIDKSSNTTLIDELETIAFGIYCTTFFRYFGRAPTVPYIFPTSQL